MLKNTIFIIVSSFLTLECTFAAPVGGEFSGPTGVIDLGADTPSLLVVSIISYAIAIAGIIAVMGTTWGGIQMILAIGDDEKFKKARYMIIYSLLGVFIAGIAYSAVKIISSLKF